MGKEKKNKHKQPKNNPIGLPSVCDNEIEENNLVQEKAYQTIERIIEQISSINMEEKLNGVHTLETMSYESVPAVLVSQNSELIKIIGPLLIDHSDSVRAATAAALRSIADNGGEEATSNLLKNDIITPLAALLKRHYSKWRPNNDSPSKIRKPINYEKETFLQAVNLLWTLAEKNDIVLKRSEEENLLSVLLPVLNTQIYDLETSIMVIQCILTLSEENPSMIKKIEANKEQVIRLFELEASDSLNEAEVLMLRTLAAGLVINIYNGFSKHIEQTVAGKSLTILSKTLNFDCEEKLQKIITLIDKEKNEISNKMQKEMKQLKTIINAQIQAVEMLANLCTDHESSDQESNFDNCDLSESDDGNIIDENEPMEELIEMDSHLCIEAIEAIISQNLIQTVLKKTSPISNNIEQILKTKDYGIDLLKTFHDLRCRSFLCLTNIILNLNSDALGGVDYLFRIWSETGNLIFKQSNTNDDDLLDAATSLMRSALQKINQLQANPFSQLSLTDLQPMLNSEQLSSSANVRANLINILGSLSLILVKSDLTHTTELVKHIVEFLMNSCLSEPKVWVIAEALDAIMDIFAEDETDQIALEINLIQKLTTISPILQTKFRQQKQSLGSNITIVSTVKANLGRFLKYKKKRISLLR